MPRTVPQLTHSKIQNAKPKTSEYSLCDGQGLYLRVRVNGSKSWIFNYSNPFTKKRTNLSLGQFPALSLSQARELRQEHLQLLARRIDPKSHREETQRNDAVAHQNTLSAVADRWIKTKRGALSAGYAMDVMNSLANHILPTLGELPLHLISAPMAIQALRPVADRGNLELVRRLCQRLNMIFDFAVNTGVIAVNPLTGVRKAFPAPVKRHLPTIKPIELPALLLAVENGKLTDQTRALFYWQLRTMLRPAEAVTMKWSEIDSSTQQWHIPKHNMKMKRPHTIPLSSQMLDFLEEMRNISGNREYVFPSRVNPRRPMNSQSLNVALGRLGYRGILVSHGLRSIASTYLNESGIDPWVVERALSHVEKNETVRAYNRAEYLVQMREALQLWSDYIDSCKPQPVQILQSAA